MDEKCDLVWGKNINYKRDEAGHLGFYVMGNFVMYTSPSTIRTIKSMQVAQDFMTCFGINAVVPSEFTMGGAIIGI
jgi:hypothetical protein